MAKYRKFNRKDLTPIQKQERSRRRMMRDRILFGMPTPKGTKPRQYAPTGEPTFKPMPRPGLPSFEGLGDAFSWIWGLLALFPRFGQRRRRRQAELAEERRSQSIKARGVK